MRANGILRAGYLFTSFRLRNGEARMIEEDPGRRNLACREWLGCQWGRSDRRRCGNYRSRYIVTNRSRLRIAALNNGVVSSTSPANPSNESKIIYVKGTIDANVDDAQSAAELRQLLQQQVYPEKLSLPPYDPAVWGRLNPSGHSSRRVQLRQPLGRFACSHSRRLEYNYR